MVKKGKKSTCQCRRRKRCGFDPWVGKIKEYEMMLHVRKAEEITG